MNTNNFNGFQAYSDPNSNNTNTNNPINSSVLIPGTCIPNGNTNDVYQLYAPPGIQPMLCRVITGGNDGPLYVPTTNPSFAYNSKNLFGHICTSCGKGILLMDMEMVRNGNGIILCYHTLVCPFLCFYFRYCKNRKCTSCKGEFPNTWCCMTID